MIKGRTLHLFLGAVEALSKEDCCDLPQRLTDAVCKLSGILWRCTVAAPKLHFTDLIRLISPAFTIIRWNF